MSTTKIAPDPHFTTTGGVQRQASEWFDIVDSVADGSLPVTPTGSSVSRALGDLIKFAAPRRFKIATLGDSRLAKGWGNAAVKYGSGVQYWTEMLTRARVRFPRELNFSVSGYTTDMALAQSPLCAASDADMVLFWCDINDSSLRQAGSGSAVTVAKTIENISAMVNEQRAAGKIVVVFASSPIGSPSTAFTGDVLKGHMYIAQYLRGLDSLDGCHVIDMWPEFCDMTVNTGVHLSTMLYDGTHLSPTAALATAEKLAAIINLYVPSCDALPGSPADVYSTINPTGALNLDPFWIGATGGTAGAGASGTVPASHTLASTDAGLTVVGSIVTKYGRKWYQMVISGTPTTDFANVSLSANDTLLANLLYGESVEALCEVEVDAGAANVHTPCYEIRASAGSPPTLSQSGLLGNTGHLDGPSPAVAYAGVIRCDTIVTGEGGSGSSTSSSSQKFMVYGEKNKAASMTLRIGRNIKRKVF